MAKYLFIESRDPFQNLDVKKTWDLACGLAKKGHGVTMFLVQNGVLAARKGAAVSTLTANEDISVFADDLSLAERGMTGDDLCDSVSLETIDRLTAILMEDGCRPIWN